MEMHARASPERVYYRSSSSSTGTGHRRQQQQPTQVDLNDEIVMHDGHHYAVKAQRMAVDAAMSPPADPSPPAHALRGTTKAFADSIGKGLGLCATRADMQEFANTAVVTGKPVAVSHRAVVNPPRAAKLFARQYVNQ